MMTIEILSYGISFRLVRLVSWLLYPQYSHKTMSGLHLRLSDAIRTQQCQVHHCWWSCHEVPEGYCQQQYPRFANLCVSIISRLNIQNKKNQIQDAWEFSGGPEILPSELLFVLNYSNPSKKIPIPFCSSIDDTKNIGEIGFCTHNGNKRHLK